METEMKPWFKIKEGVEYSTDFNFFLKHQLFIVISGNKYKFCSRLESKCFLFTSAIFYDYFFSEEAQLKICERIHKEILNGEHGTGIFVD